MKDPGEVALMGEETEESGDDAADGPLSALMEILRLRNPEDTEEALIAVEFGRTLCWNF